MEDREIISLFFERNEKAVFETDKKYGGLLRKISMNLLGVFEDAEECVNDTYHTAWLCMPPKNPQSLRAFLGRITRNISVSRYRKNRAKKRYNGIDIMLSELSDCVPDSEDTSHAVEARELTRFITVWLAGLSENDRELFIKRYWYCDSVKQLASKSGLSPNKVSQRLFALRCSLKNELENEEIAL